jgi:hypothetical protein
MADLSNEASCIQLTANIVSAYVRNNSVSSAEIPALISQVYLALMRVSSGAAGAGPAEPLNCCFDKTLDHTRIPRLSGRREEVQIPKAPLGHPVPDDA